MFEKILLTDTMFILIFIVLIKVVDNPKEIPKNIEKILNRIAIVLCFIFIVSALGTIWI